MSLAGSRKISQNYVQKWNLDVVPGTVNGSPISFEETIIPERRWEGEVQIACVLVLRSLDHGEPLQNLLEKTFHHSEILAFALDVVTG